MIPPMIAPAANPAAAPPQPPPRPPCPRQRTVSIFVCAALLKLVALPIGTADAALDISATAVTAASAVFIALDIMCSWFAPTHCRGSGANTFALDQSINGSALLSRRLTLEIFCRQFVEVILPVAGIIAAQIAQIRPIVDAGRMHVVERQPHRVVADRQHFQNHHEIGRASCR